MATPTLIGAGAVPTSSSHPAAYARFMRLVKNKSRAGSEALGALSRKEAFQIFMESAEETYEHSLSLSLSLLSLSVSLSLCQCFLFLRVSLSLSLYLLSTSLFLSLSLSLSSLLGPLPMLVCANECDMKWIWHGAKFY